MDMQGVKVDPKVIEQGAWIGEKYGTPIPEMGDLCLKVRGQGNADWRALQRKLVDAVPRNKRIGGSLASGDVDRITAICLREAGVLDWENLTDGDQAVAYSKDAASQYLTDPQFQAFRDAALWACTIVGNAATTAVKDDAKN